MTQDDGGYELTPKPEKPPAGIAGSTPGAASDGANRDDSSIFPAASQPSHTGQQPFTSAAQPNATAPKPGDPGWVPPVPVIEPADPVEGEDPDVETHKGMAVLGYILFLIPLVAAPGSKFARYHANQGLLLFILLIVSVIAVVVLDVALWVVGKFLTITILAFFFGCAFHLLQIGLLVGWVALVIMGIINAANGLKKPVPVIGHWTLIK